MVTRIAKKKTGGPASMDTAARTLPIEMAES
jgi:hypothetical protein